MEYKVPDWGRKKEEKGNEQCSIEVIKQGVVTETIPLHDKGWYVLGRMEPLCDIVLLHPSISRTHAAFQYDSSGQLFVKDLGSTYGTMKNKKKLVPNVFEQVNIGDVIVFGESTRIYTIVGDQELMPEEYESVNLKQMRQKLQERAERRKAADEKEAGSGASWGFGEDAEEDSDEEVAIPAKTSIQQQDSAHLPEYLRNFQEKQVSYECSISAADVHRNDKKIFAKLQTKISKLSNIQIESERILAKEMDQGGLSEGQKNAVDRNEKRKIQLEKEVQELEEQIRRNNMRRMGVKDANSLKRSRKPHEDDEYDYPSDEDDFYDRTKKLRKTTTSKSEKNEESKPVETEKSLAIKVQQINYELREAESTIQKLSKELEPNTNEDESKIDPLDQFMRESSRASQVELLAKARAQRQELQKTLEHYNKMLAIARPAIVSTFVDIPEKVKEKTPIHTTVQDESPVQDKIPKATNEATTSSSTEGTKISRPISRESEKTRQPKKIVHRQPDPTKVPKKTMSHTKNKADPNILEGNDVVWVPPANQTGDGRTSLNDKFGY